MEDSSPGRGILQRKPENRVFSRRYIASGVGGIKTSISLLSHLSSFFYFRQDFQVMLAEPPGAGKSPMRIQLFDRFHIKTRP